MPDPAESIAESPGLPVEEDGEPVFGEPWQAQAFAMTVALHENGHISWPQWAETLGAVLEEAGASDPPENYYHHWLAALERLTEHTGIVSSGERKTRTSAWGRAARATPHGVPIELTNDPLAGDSESAI